jgi:hypothetical protein
MTEESGIKKKGSAFGALPLIFSDKDMEWLRPDSLPRVRRRKSDPA